HDQRRKHEHRLALDEVEGVDTEPFGNRRAGSEGEHHASDHQDDEAGKQIAVDGPQPLGEGTSVGTADHQATSRPEAEGLIARTEAANASPRTSKLAN